MSQYFSRRHFLKTSLGAAGLVAAPSLLAKGMASACQLASSRPYGIQLYMVRDMFAQDPAGTLEKLAGAGFQQIELFGVGGSPSGEGAPLFGLSIDEMAALVKEFGLSVPSAHINSDVEDASYISELGEKLGIDYFIEPMAGEFLNFDGGKVNLTRPESEEQVVNIAERLNRRGQTMKSLGFNFAYHNHNFEFDKVNGETAYDILMDNTDPSLVNAELDLGWVAAAGLDPVKTLSKYKDRVVACHMKDLDPSIAPAKNDPKMVIPEMTQIKTPGDGTTDFAAITELLNKNKVKYRYVEVDVTPNPFEDAVRGLCYLSTLG